MKLLGFKEVQRLLGLKHPEQVRREIAKKGFPAPVAKLAATTVWRESDVRRWMERRS